MRKFYRTRRNRLLSILRSCPWADRLTIEEADAGLHFLVYVDTQLSDRELTDHCARLGLQVQCLSDFHHAQVPPEGLHRIVVNYSGLDDAALDKLAQILQK